MNFINFLRKIWNVKIVFIVNKKFYKKNIEKLLRKGFNAFFLFEIILDYEKMKT